jgi:hypothetical protein
MLIYYRSTAPHTEFDIGHWPRARKVLRHQLNRRRFSAFAPHLRHRRPGHRNGGTSSRRGRAAR